MCLYMQALWLSQIFEHTAERKRYQECSIETKAFAFLGNTQLFCDNILVITQR